MFNENGLDALGNLLQMTIQIDLLETSRDRVVDGVYVAVSIRQCTDDVDELGFSTANKKNDFSFDFATES